MVKDLQVAGLLLLLLSCPMYTLLLLQHLVLHLVLHLVELLLDLHLLLLLKGCEDQVVVLDSQG